EDGTWLYLTSDGYVDQNNIERKKLGSAKLCGLIESAHHASSSEQKHLFESVLDQHQQQAEQRDDITLVGVKI
ncbi:MAG: SpoIIE family protein phosphatase, partial [Bacteroidota bacterium]